MLDLGMKMMTKRTLKQSFSPVSIAQLAQLTENEVIGVQAGIMDPFVINCCPRAHALLLDCRDLSHESYPWPNHWPLLLVDCRWLPMAALTRQRVAAPWPLRGQPYWNAQHVRDATFPGQ